MNDHDFDPVQDLLEVLRLEHLGEAVGTLGGAPGDLESDLGEVRSTVFLGRSQPQPHGRVFGGQVLAQSVMAAGRTVQESAGAQRHIHSLHAYFVRPGDASHPIRFSVEHTRDGRSFSTRRVHAIQRGEVILSAIASFQDDSDGIDHQDEMPAAPSPDLIPGELALAEDTADPVIQFFAFKRPIDQRHVEGPVYFTAGQQHIADQNVWIRCKDSLPDDPLLHASVLAYASDYTLLEPVLRKHGLSWSDKRLRGASLDHTMWFHRPVRADEWLLYVQHSPSAQGGRGLGVGRMFAADGRLAVTVGQEGMLRVRAD